jgi:hypothetical protein
MAQHLLVSLKLQWTDHDNYKATVETQVLDSCYKAKSIRTGLPPGMEGLLEVAYITAEISHDVQPGQKCGQVVHKIDQTLDKLSSAGHPLGAFAFVLVNGDLVGTSALTPFPR